jgi:hypothetical protein
MYEPAIRIEDKDGALQHAPLFDQNPVAAPEFL